jgi:hypothetical protein
MRRSNAVSIHALQAYKPNSREAFFNGAGEINAGSTKDALQTLANLIKAVEAGNINFDSAAVNDNGDKVDTSSLEFRTERHNNYCDAHRKGAQSQEFADVGAAIASTLQTTQERVGLMRNYLLRGDLQPGDPVPRFRRKDRSNVYAVVSTDFSAVTPRFVTDTIIEGYEVVIAENIRVLDREVNRGNIDLVEDVYLRAQQGIAVREDQLFIKQARKAASISTNSRLTTSGVTPNLLGLMRADLDAAAVPAAQIIIGTQVWPDFLSSNFAAAINPVTNYELISTGRLGKILDMDITTDGLRPRGLRVLDPKELFMFSSPEYLGGYTDRGPITATPRDNFDDGQPAKGWYMYEEISIIIANAGAVSLLVRG